MRLFVAIDIDEAIRQRIMRFMEGVQEFVPDARWMWSESLHVTLKFIGERKDESIEEIKQSLAGIKSKSFAMNFRNYGFFPTAESARVFWIGIESAPQLAALAKTIDESLVLMGVPKETHAYSPHLTLARGGSGSGAPGQRKGDRSNRGFERLQEKLAALPAPEFGTMAAREFFLYQSQLSPKESRYAKIASFALK
jgi:2'-5' RNA ligase